MVIIHTHTLGLFLVKPLKKCFTELYWKDPREDLKNRQEVGLIIYGEKNNHNQQEED